MTDSIITTQSEVRQIPLSKGKFAIIDVGDYELINQYKWHYMTAGYAAKTKYIGYTNGKKKNSIILMHRLIMAPSANEQVDHINHNRIDNRRANLRICTKSQNQWNRVKVPNTSSRYKGVTWHDRDGNWKAQIGKDGKHYHLGYFSFQIDAALAYNTAAKQLFGVYANLNIIL